MSRQIRLTNSELTTTVNDDMFDELSQWEWYLLPVNDMQYAARDVVDESGIHSVVLMHLQIVFPKEPHRWTVPA